MSSLIAAWAIVIKRSLAHWRLLSSIVLGVTLAVAISSSTVIYFQALRGLGLERDLRLIPPEQQDVQVGMDLNRASLQDYVEARRAVDGVVRRYMSWLVSGQVRSVRSATFYANPVDRQPPPPLDDQLRGSLSFMTDMDKHIRVVAGRMPQAVRADGSTPPVVEGILALSAASLFSVSVGDEFTFTPFWDDQTPNMRVRVVGFFDPLLPEDHLWTEGPLRSTRQLSQLNALPLLVPEETYFQGLSVLFPNANSAVGWTLRTDVRRINPSNMDRALLGLRFLEGTLESRYVNFRLVTPLTETLRTYQTKLFFMRAPLLVVSLMVVAVVLYYLVLLAGLLVERLRGENAVVQSRGASYRQIVGMHAMEALLVSGVGLLVGPPLAAAGIALLGLTPAFSALSGGGLLPVFLSWEAYQLALLGAGLAFIALIIPAARAARQNVVHFRQEATRPTQQPFFQRFYLDVGFLVVTAFLLTQLRSQQNLVVTEAILGEQAVNQLLVLAPSLFLIAVSFLILRLFPMGLNLASRLVRAVAPAWSMLGLWELGRNPAHYGRLVLLLMLAAGLGVFAASFGGTLDRSYQERALYAAGSDIRLSGLDLSARWPDDAPPETTYRKISGVREAAAALRQSGSVRSRPWSGDYRMLAIDQSAFGKVAWFRDDFSTSSLTQLLSMLDEKAPELGVPLPQDASKLSLWARPVRADATTSLFIQMQDNAGRYFTYGLGTLDFDDWRRLEVTLDRPARRPLGRALEQPVPIAPYTFMSIYTLQGRRQGGLASGSILLDDMMVAKADGTEELFQDFESNPNWGIVQITAEAGRDSLDVSPVTRNNKGSSGVFTWQSGTVVTERGIAPGLDDTPLPVLASSSFLASTGHKIGDEASVTVGGVIIPVLLKHEVGYFPTLDPLEEDFLVGPIAPILARMNVKRPGTEAVPGEFWIKAAPGADRPALSTSLGTAPFRASGVTDSQVLLQMAHADPLVAAGWTALLFIAYLSVLFISVVGFVVHAYVSAQKRRLTFAALRGMGLSVHQLVGVVWFEHALIVAIGLAFGTWIGGRIGEALLPFLTLTETGEKVLPPFIIQTNWGAVGLTYSVMGLVFTVVTGAVIVLFSRLAISRALRTSEV